MALAVKPIIITNGMRYSLSTGNWTSQQNFTKGRTGVSQALNRYNYGSTLSQIRRVNTPSNHQGKNTKQRQLHNTQWGIICPSETPEGEAVGLVKNFSLMARVSKDTTTLPIYHVIFNAGLKAKGVNVQHLEV